MSFDRYLHLYLLYTLPQIELILLGAVDLVEHVAEALLGGVRVGDVPAERGEQQLQLAAQAPGARLQPLQVVHPHVLVLGQQRSLLARLPAPPHLDNRHSITVWELGVLYVYNTFHKIYDYC